MAEIALDILIAQWQRRLRKLEQDAAQGDRSADLTRAALEELASSIEELHVAAEELRAQNDELAAAHNALEAERRRYLDLFDFAPDPYVVTSADGTIREANRAAAALLGVTQQYLMGKPLSVFVPEAARRAFRMTVFAVARDPGVTGRAWDLDIEARDGRQTPVAVTVTAQRTGDEVVGLRWLLRDVTERRRFDRTIRQANRALESRVGELGVANAELEAFEYSIAHDLRAPLRHIEGFTRLLIDEYAGRLDDTARATFERIISATKVMGDLIDALYSLSRVGGEVVVETVDLSKLVHEIAGELSAQAPERAVELVIQDGVTAVGDRQLLRIVLENLLGNAWKFTRRHATARIEFGLTVVGGEPVYFVRDDGAGFEMARAERLFGPFQRLHGRAEFPGSGIGLAIVRRIVRRHGGRVWIEGAIEQGASVYFTLPNDLHPGDSARAG